MSRNGGQPWGSKDAVRRSNDLLDTYAVDAPRIAERLAFVTRAGLTVERIVNDLIRSIGPGTPMSTV